MDGVEEKSGGPLKRDGYKAIVVGSSAGGLNALSALLPSLPADFRLPMIIAQHVHPTQNGYFTESLNRKSKLPVRLAGEKESILEGHIYFAPPNYHLLIERDETFSLSIDPRVNYARPSIEVLFESAVYVWSSGLIGVMLTGANNDGAEAMRLIKRCGGLTIAQDPSTAESPMMPQSAIDAGGVDEILTLEQIARLLQSLDQACRNRSADQSQSTRRF
jgi:two-component system, chemotaxis family, protein-glutamate methylesterase/glutaminase